MISILKIGMRKYTLTSIVHIQMRSLNVACENSDQRYMHHLEIAKFYDGKSVFMTGGTGFLGKVVLEKLLYSCPKFDKIYMLIRADTKEHAKQRIDSMIQMSPFQRLKKESISKIVPVVGDLGSADLGIQPDDMEQITKQVSIVIHSAATINFNEPLRVAMNYNVEGSRNVLRLAKRLNNIEAFVHVSSMYCVAAADKSELEEVLYPAPTTLDNVYKALDRCEDTKLPSDILHGYSNSYVFTKLLAENVLAEERGSIPLVILRPSMVGSCLHEPVGGYLGSVNVHSYLLYMIAKGYARTIYANENNLVDLIPADYVANMIIVAAARCRGCKDLMIYNCATSSCNPLTFRMLSNLSSQSIQNTFNDPPLRKVHFVDSKMLTTLLTLVTQIVPAYMIDIWSKICGKTPRLFPAQKYLLRMLYNNEFFYSNSWKMKSDKARSLHRSLSDGDRLEFRCDPADVSWKEYMALYVQSIGQCITSFKFKK